MSAVEGREQPSRAAPFGAIALSTALHAGIALGLLSAAPTAGPPALVWVEAARVAVATEPPAPEPPRPAPEPPKPAPEPPKPAPLARRIADAPRPVDDEPRTPAPPPQRGPEGAPSAGPGPELAGASANGSGVASTDGGTGLGGPPTPRPGVGSVLPLPAPIPETLTAPLCPRPRVAYPAEARRRSLEGEVTARIVVGEDGRIDGATIVRSAGPTLDDAVLAVVRGMRCEPGRLGSRPVKTPIPYTVRFVLEDP